MASTIHWSSDLKIVTNEKTGTKRYFMARCGVWTRISKADYENREADSNRSDSFQTKVSGHLIHNSKTVYGTHYSNLG